MAARKEDEPVLMRVSFKDGTAASDVRELVGKFPFETLAGNPYTQEVESDLRLIFRKPSESDADALVDDGGLLFETLFESDGRGPFLDISRRNDGRDLPAQLPPVIREKQVCRKLVANLEQSECFASSRIRPFGSGSF